MKYLYLVDYWVPFPSSEYGGIVAVVAENDNECHDVLMNWRDECEDQYDSNIMGNVVKAQKFPLANEHASVVVENFVT